MGRFIASGGAPEATMNPGAGKAGQGMTARSVLAALVASATAPAAAGADATVEVPVEAEVRSGPLALSRPGPAVPLAGGEHAVTLRLVDARGTAAGWSVAMSAPASAVTEARVDCLPGSTCTAPASSIEYPVVAGGAPVAVANAARGTGLGAFLVTLRVAPSAGSGTATSPTSTRYGATKRTTCPVTDRSAPRRASQGCRGSP